MYEPSCACMLLAAVQAAAMTIPHLECLYVLPLPHADPMLTAGVCTC